LLLDGKEFSDELVSSLKKAKETVIIISAFIKSDALLHLAAQTDLVSKKNVLIVARWQKRDIIAGASDVNVFNLCSQKGWRFGISQQMHGKVFCIDDEEIFLGSANLTRRGLQFGLIGNHEFGTRIPAAAADMTKLKSFIDSEVRLIDQRLFSLIVNEIEECPTDYLASSDPSWSNSLMQQLNSPVKFLWVNELPRTKPQAILFLQVSNSAALSDCELFGIDFDRISRRELSLCFKSSRVYKWLVAKLKDAEELYFGELTRALHSALLDDPKPYRMEVKDAVANIYAWAELCDDIFEVTRPRHSQLIALRV